MHFRDRLEAGQLLADRLAPYANRTDTLVLALPRGGVPVGFALAQRLSLPLDILGVRKLGVPGQEELAFGAIASGGVRILDTGIVDALKLSPETIEQVTAAEQYELERRESAFGSGGATAAIRDRTVILVDDGIATGSTMLSAIAAVRQTGASRVIVASGVAPASTAQMLASRADEVICLFTPADFRAVSLHYEDFPQLSDENVREYLRRARERHLEGEA